MTMPSVRVDFVAFDESSREHVLYLVEDGPWPSGLDDWQDCLRRIQGRVLDAVDAVIDGGVARVFPDSAEGRVRIQVDSPTSEPEQVRELVSMIRQFLHEDPGYREAVKGSRFAKGIRVVTGHELGRFS